MDYKEKVLTLYPNAICERHIDYHESYWFSIYNYSSPGKYLINSQENEEEAWENAWKEIEREALRRLST